MPSAFYPRRMRRLYLPPAASLRTLLICLGARERADLNLICVILIHEKLGTRGKGLADENPRCTCHYLFLSCAFHKRVWYGLFEGPPNTISQ